jgi:hypothetical protein
MKNCPIYIKAIYAGWLEIFFIKPDFLKQIDRDLLRLGAKNKKKNGQMKNCPIYIKAIYTGCLEIFLKKGLGE